jgi:molybdopterin converting factor small subunit
VVLERVPTLRPELVDAAGPAHRYVHLLVNGRNHPYLPDHPYLRLRVSGTTSIGLVLAAFADTLRDAQLDGPTVALAMSAWSKYLTLQLHLMLLGYGVARDLRTGTRGARIRLYGRVRHLVGCAEILANATPAARLAEVLSKLFNYSPVLRDEALERIWEARTPDGSLWQEVLPAYAVRRGWRILLNGRDVGHEQGSCMRVSDCDTIALFPPGR